MLDLIVLHGEFSLFTVRCNFWYQIYQNQRQKILCQLMALITIALLLAVARDRRKSTCETSASRSTRRHMAM